MHPSLCRRGVVWLAVLAPSLAGCFLFDALDNASGSGGLEYAAYRQGCGPTDGPALEIFLTEAPASCERLDEIDYNAPELEHVWVTLYGIGAPEAGPEFRVGPNVTTDHEGGWARQCPGDGGECVLVRTGGVTFSDDRGGPFVEVDLEFEDGAQLQGRFSLRQCDQVFICG